MGRADREHGAAEGCFLALGEDEAGGEGFVVHGWVWWSAANETDVGGESGEGWGGGEDFDGRVWGGAVVDDSGFGTHGRGINGVRGGGCRGGF